MQNTERRTQKINHEVTKALKEIKYKKDTKEKKARSDRKGRRVKGLLKRKALSGCEARNVIRKTKFETSFDAAAVQRLAEIDFLINRDSAYKRFYKEKKELKILGGRWV